VSPATAGTCELRAGAPVDDECGSVDEAGWNMGSCGCAVPPATPRNWSPALGQQGRFVVLQESVTTSARKFRTYSTRELLTSMFRIALRGPKAMQRREGLEFWYGERRNDPPDA
jgi:hypothetical protein